MEIKNFYQKNGYILIKNLFKKNLILNLKKDIASIFNSNLKTIDKDIIDLFSKNFVLFHENAKKCQKLFSLYEIMFSLNIKKVLYELDLKYPLINTTPLISFSCQSTAKEEKYWKVPAHQDWESTKGSLNGLTCWIPLINTKNLGSLELIPESHKNGAINHISKEKIDLNLNEEQFLPIEMEIGDALFLVISQYIDLDLIHTKIK